MSSNVKPVPVTIQTKGFNFDLSEQAAIATNYDALSEAIASNPGRYAVWGMLEAEARKVYEALASKLEILEAELFEEYRASIGSPVDAIKACVKKDPRRVSLQEDVLEAKANAEKLLAARRTIGEQKKDSLLALASNMRAEMQSRTGMNVLERQQRDIDERARGSRGPGAPRRVGPQAAKA
jgi:hypothetical protein